MSAATSAMSNIQRHSAGAEPEMNALEKSNSGTAPRVLVKDSRHGRRNAVQGPFSHSTSSFGRSLADSRCNVKHLSHHAHVVHADKGGHHLGATHPERQEVGGVAAPRWALRRRRACACRRRRGGLRATSFDS